MEGTRDEENESSFAFLSSSDEEESLEEWVGKPAPTGLLLEPSSLTEELVECNSCCPKCQGRLEIEFVTVTVATSVKMTCKNDKCSYIDYGRSPAAASVSGFAEDDHGRNIVQILR